MAELSVTATPEPDAWPPRVRVDVTDTGNSPAISSVTVVRTANGVETAVRGNDGAPLQLAPAGTDTRTGTIFDPEAPFGQEVTYATVQQPENSSGAVVSDSLVPWLVHLGSPHLSQPVDFRIGSFQSRKRAVRSGVFWPLGRDTAIVITDGRRKAPESQFTAHTTTPAQYEGMVSLLDDAGVMLLNVPPNLGLMLKTAYIAVLDVDEVRPSNIGEDARRDWVMPYVEVAMPTGGTPSSWTYNDAMARFATYDEAKAAYATYDDSLDPLG